MLRLHGVESVPGRVDATLAALDLEPDALKRPVRAFSKGMTQKLGLAACLLADKRLLVLDEPTSGLDPKARALFKRELVAQRAHGRTVFLTSHLLADIERLCDRMAILHAGAIRFLGTPAELLARHGSDDMEQAFLACIDDQAAPANAAAAALDEATR